MRFANRALRWCVIPLAALSAMSLLVSGCGGGSSGSGATSIDPPANQPDPPGEVPGFPFVVHLDQANVTAGLVLFAELFTIGDELFEIPFNGLDGVGVALLPDGSPLARRFSRVPPGGGRFTGPNGQACAACHNSPIETSAGEAASNVVQDPSLTGVPPFNFRNAISLFGSATPQRLAEEITEDLHTIRADAGAATTPGGSGVTLPLASKGISFGEITAMQSAGGVLTFDTSAVEGVDPDLVVRPYGWKGNVTTLRDFVRGAALNELGLEADELVAKDPSMDLDPDGDGVEEELSVGDITAITIYIGAQEIPTTVTELIADGVLPPLPSDLALAIAVGQVLFEDIGCTTCHIPQLVLSDPVFEEPTLRGNGNYIDTDIDPDLTSLDPANPFRFNLIQEGDPPRLVPSPSGGAIVPLFGDLKRHNMGAHLADAQATPVSDANGATLMNGGAPVLVPESTFLTAELWGVGNSGPWLHDGRAGTLEEAILLHGVDAPPPIGDPARSEAQETRDAFVALSEQDRAAIVEFLESLVLFSFGEEED